MQTFLIRPELSLQASLARPRVVLGAAALALALVFSAQAQQPAVGQTSAPQPPVVGPTASQGQAAPATTTPQASPAAAESAKEQAVPTTAATAPVAAAPTAPLATTQVSGAMTEAELKQLVIGKELYLRGGYLENSLSFDEHGRALGHPKQGSYTLCAIQIERAHLTKHKVELEGTRYGLHFVGQLAYEDSSKAVDRVRITPKKKVVKITIDREIVVKPKKVKAPKAVGKGGKEKDNKGKEAAKGAAPAAKPVDAKTAPSETPVERAKVSDAKPAPPETPAEAPKAQLAPPQVDEKDEPELTPEEQLKASIAAAPEAERPADPKSVTTTISPAHAAQVLKDALDQIFAKGLDERMLASMPDFWKHYYEAAAAKVDYRPKDPSIYRQGMVDQKARLLTKFEPDSNEFAQANGVAGMAQYHTVVGPDGKVGEVAISRPIGFGLDESAVEAIRKASFEPAIKDGKPVAVMLELNVPFRIFSHRTEVHATPEPDSKPAETILPGPYSVLR